MRKSTGTRWLIIFNFIVVGYFFNMLLQHLIMNVNGIFLLLDIVVILINFIGGFLNLRNNEN